jgi:threonyl-tRNA synthetase
MIEHYAGRFPLWLNPVGVRIVAMNTVYGHDLAKDLRAMGVRVHVDDRNESMGKKVREAQLSRSTHVVVVGDKEAECGTVSFRDGSSVDRGIFLTKMCKELENRE